MKKTYMKPTAKSVELNLSAIILAGSNPISPEGLEFGGDKSEDGADTDDVL